MEEKKDWADLIYENRKAIVVAVVIIIVVVMGFGLFAHYRQKKAEEAAYYFGKGLEALAKAEASQNATAEDYQKALKYFEKAEEVGGGRESDVATAMKGRVLMLMGKKKEGVSAVKEALGKLKGSYLEPVFTAETADEKLIKSYLNRDNPILEDYLRFHLAMVLLGKGDKAAAKKELETLKGKFPDSPFAKDADRVLEVLR